MFTDENGRVVATSTPIITEVDPIWSAASTSVAYLAANNNFSGNNTFNKIVVNTSATLPFGTFIGNYNTYGLSFNDYQIVSGLSAGINIPLIETKTSADLLGITKGIYLIGKNDDYGTLALGGENSTTSLLFTKDVNSNSAFLYQADENNNPVNLSSFTLFANEIKLVNSSDAYAINFADRVNISYSSSSNRISFNNASNYYFNGTDTNNESITVKTLYTKINDNISLPTSVRNLQIVDGYLYLVLYGTSSVDSFRIIDISNPHQPRVVGGQNITNLPHAQAKRVLVSGNYAYLIFGSTNTSTDILRVLDISNKSNPKVIAGANFDTNVFAGPGEPAYLSGNYIYLLGDNKVNPLTKSDLLIIDISDPFHPKKVYQLENLPRGGWDIKVNGNYAYGCFHDTNTPLAIIDIKDKKNPFIISTSSVGGISQDCWSVDFWGSYLYLGLGDFYGNPNTSTFRIVNIDDPYNPVVVSGENLDFGLPDGHIGALNYIKVTGRYLYATTWQNYFFKVDISSSTNPVLEEYDTLFEDIGDDDVINPLTFDFSGNYLFVGFAPIPPSGESTRYLRVYSLGGISSGSGYFSSLISGQLRVNNDAIFDRRLSVADSLSIGLGGILSEGGISVISSSSVNYFAGYLNVGTTTETATNAKFVVDNGIVSTGTYDYINWFKSGGLYYSDILGSNFYFSGLGYAKTTDFNNDFSNSVGLLGIANSTGSIGLLGLGQNGGTGLNVFNADPNGVALSSLQGINYFVGNTYMLSNVGIGTTNPIANLDVRGSIAAGINGTEFLVSSTGTVTTGDIIPLENNTYSLGYPDRTWKHLYVGPGSIYVNGQRVISTNPDDKNVIISADLNQNIIIETKGSGNIQLNNTANIQLTSGQIQLDGTVLLKNNVGIGTNSPASKLDVLGTSEQLRLGYNDSNAVKFTVGSSSNLTITPLNNNTSGFNFTDNSNNSILNIDTENRRIGVGIKNPKGSLEIYNNATTSNSDGSSPMELNGQDSIILYGSNSIIGQTNGSITWVDAGRIRRRAMITAITERDDSDYLGLSFYTQGTDGSGPMYESMRISHSGNVGIGTISPTKKLDVNGDIKIVSSSAYYLDDVKIAYGDSSKNNYFFAGAGNTTTTGIYNLALGSSALYSNTTGNYNLAFGVSALRNNTAGYSNIALGQWALFNNNTGNYNLALGYQALINNNTGNYNLALGYRSLYNNTTGNNNLVLGYYAGHYETTSDNFYVNNRDRLNSDNEKSQSLLYGKFADSVNNQFLKVNGKLGVNLGTLNPVAQFHVLGTSEQLRLGYNDSNAVKFTVGSNNNLTITPLNNNTSGFNFTDNSNNSILNIDTENRRIGIGTTTPTAPLHVYSSGNYTHIKLSTGNGTEGVANYRLQADSNISGQGKSFGIYNEDDSAWKFFINGNGNVGIGTYTPSQKLSISGTLGIIEGGSSPTYYTIFQGGDQLNNITYTLPTSITANGFLTTNNYGVLSWTTNIPVSSLSWSNLIEPVGNLILNHNIYNTIFNTQVSTGTFLTINANNLTSGKGLYLFSSSTSVTGNLAEFISSGDNMLSTGNVLKIAQTGSFSNVVGLMITNLGLGASFRVNDETGDNDDTPFLIDKSGNVGVKKSSPTVALDVNGDIKIASSSAYYLGDIKIAYGDSSKNNYFFGPAGTTTLGYSNVVVGNTSLMLNTNGSYNTAIGINSMVLNTIGNNNVAIGFSSLILNSVGSNNVAIGNNSLAANQGDGNIAIGYYAGRYETTSDNFYVNNRDRLNSDNEKSQSLLYGKFADSVNNQFLKVNGKLGVNLGTSSPDAKLEIFDEQTFSYPVIGTTKGSIHIEPVLGINNNSMAITFGGNNNGISTNRAEAGIYVQSANTYGTKMYFATTNSFSSGSQARMVIDSAGKIGIGTTSPSANFHLYGNGISQYIDSASGFTPNLEFRINNVRKWRLYNDSSNDRFYIVDGDNDNGVYLAQNSTSWTANSDIRLKENLVPITNALQRVLNLNAYTYNFIGSSKREIGLIAQEAQPQFPELVDTSSEYWGISYDRIGPILVAAIKEQQTQIQSLSNKLNVTSSEDNNNFVLNVTESNPQFNSLKVTSAATFKGTITVIGEAGFISKVTFADQVYFNQDTAGVATIIAGATSTEVKFLKPYETTPIINLTPKQKISGITWWVENETTDSFVIGIDSIVDRDLQFNWQAIAVLKNNTELSNGSNENLETNTDTSSSNSSAGSSETSSSESNVSNENLESNPDTSSSNSSAGSSEVSEI